MSCVEVSIATWINRVIIVWVAHTAKGWSHARTFANTWLLKIEGSPHKRSPVAQAFLIATLTAHPNRSSACGDFFHGKWETMHLDTNCNHTRCGEIRLNGLYTTEQKQNGRQRRLGRERNDGGLQDETDGQEMEKLRTRSLLRQENQTLYSHRNNNQRKKL